MAPHTMKFSLTLVALLLVLATFDSVRGAAVRPEQCRCEDPSVPCTCNILKPPMCMTACEKPKCKNYVQRPGECCPSCPEDDTAVEEICSTKSCSELKCENPMRLNPGDCCAVCPIPGDTDGEKICKLCPVLECQNPRKLNADDCCEVCPSTVSEEVCIHGDDKMRVGERTNEDPCKPCTCMSGGTIKCFQMRCPNMPECEKPTCPLLTERTDP